MRKKHPRFLEARKATSLLAVTLADKSTIMELSSSTNQEAASLSSILPWLLEGDGRSKSVILLRSWSKRKRSTGCSRWLRWKRCKISKVKSLSSPTSWTNPNMRPIWLNSTSSKNDRWKKNSINPNSELLSTWRRRSSGSMRKRSSFKTESKMHRTMNDHSTKKYQPSATRSSSKQMK